MSLRRNRRHESGHIWPGFVDIIASLLILILFLLLVFVLAQFFMGQALSGRDEALNRLNRQVSELSELLSLERKSNTELRSNLAQLSSELASASARAENLQGASEQFAQLKDDIITLTALKEDLESRVMELDGALGEKDKALAEERHLSEEARAHAALLAQQLNALTNGNGSSEPSARRL